MKQMPFSNLNSIDEKKIICLGLLGTAQTAVPRRADSQRNRGVQQAMLRLVVQPLGSGERPISGDG